MIGFSPLEVRVAPSRLMSVSVVVAHVVALTCLGFSSLEPYLIMVGFFVLLFSLTGVLSGFSLHSSRISCLTWDLNSRHMQLIDPEGEVHDVACVRRIAIAPYLLVLCVQRDQRSFSDWLVIASDSVDHDTFRRLGVALSLAPAVELPSKGS